MQTNRWYNYFVVIILVLLGIWLYRRSQLSEPTVATNNQDQTVESRANSFLESSGFTLPQDSPRVNLQDKTGGSSTGIATRNDDSLYTVMASLPELTTGWYQVWLTMADGSQPVLLGNLDLAKGGYLLETSSSLDQSSYGRILVTSETTKDQTPETTILEGSF